RHLHSFPTRRSSDLTIIAFVGGGGDDGAFGDTDEYIDGDGGIDFQFFTIKNFITFFTVFGWVGLGCLKSNLPLGQVILWSVLSGIAIVLIMFYLFSQMAKLRSSGTLQIRNRSEERRVGKECRRRGSTE